MSELKERDARELVVNNHYRPNEENMRVYLKSEADSVFRRLKARLARKGIGNQQLEADKNHNWRKYCCAMEEIRHQKYKRCLAVARRCHSESLWWYSKGYGFEKYDKFWERWEKRWLELAEQFKEAK